MIPVCVSPLSDFIWSLVILVLKIIEAITAIYRHQILRIWRYQEILPWFECKLSCPADAEMDWWHAIQHLTVYFTPLIVVCLKIAFFVVTGHHGQIIFQHMSARLAYNSISSHWQRQEGFVSVAMVGCCGWISAFFIDDKIIDFSWTDQISKFKIKPYFLFIIWSQLVTAKTKIIRLFIDFIERSRICDNSIFEILLTCWFFIYEQIAILFIGSFGIVVVWLELEI